MSTSGFLKRTAISVFVVAGITAPALALAGSKNVPLKMSAITQEQSGYTPTCPSKFGGTTTGTGNSSHLGKISLTAGDCITPMENHYTFKGKLTITAANGDKITGDYSGSFVPLDTPPMYSLSDAKFQITGGTGRFSNANGIVDLRGSQNIQTGKGKIEADGTISY
jgi:hypothetical protein